MYKNVDNFSSLAFDSFCAYLTSYGLLNPDLVCCNLKAKNGIYDQPEMRLSYTMLSSTNKNKNRYKYTNTQLPFSVKKKKKLTREK